MSWPEAEVAVAQPRHLAGEGSHRCSFQKVVCGLRGARRAAPSLKVVVDTAYPCGLDASGPGGRRAGAPVVPAGTGGCGSAHCGLGLDRPIQTERLRGPGSRCDSDSRASARPTESTGPQSPELPRLPEVGWGLQRRRVAPGRTVLGGLVRAAGLESVLA